MIKLIYKAAKFQDKCFVFWGIKIWRDRELNYTEVTRLNHFWGSFNFSFFYKHFHVRLCYTFIQIIFSLATYVIEGVKLPVVIQNLSNREKFTRNCSAVFRKRCLCLLPDHMGLCSTRVTAFREISMPQ